MDEIKNRLFAISLLDGRNFDKVRVISEYFSEFALIRYRVRIEVEYLLFLSKNTNLIRPFTQNEVSMLKNYWKKFTVDDAVKVKTYEKKINHDVKAVEYLLKEKFLTNSLSDVVSFIHFGLTSYDVNIPSYGLMLQEYKAQVFLPMLDTLLATISTLIHKTKAQTMLGRTHGQPALPTTMGKEIAVYYHRLKKEYETVQSVKLEGKLTGAVGNFNALSFVSPNVDWVAFSKKFIQSLGLTPNIITTQILPYDSWIRFFDCVVRTNNILLGFTVDIWWYISFEYFLQKKKEEEVGSSTMSHKINPITFENAEGNLGLSNSLFEFFGRKLSYSRLQRDLSDSTIKRDFGLAFGFTYLAWDSILQGLARIEPNPKKMESDLESHWEIFSEGIQTYLRMKGYKDAFELLKDKTRGKTMNRQEMHTVIDSLPIALKDKKYLKIQSLDQYVGLAVELSKI